MKKEQQQICESIKLTQVKMVENEKLLRSLHADRRRLRQSLADDAFNLGNDVDCLPLRRRDPHAYDGPVVTIPLISSH